MSSESKSRRIIELDLLRGFFIAVIILDHLQFWPSYLQYFTGQGRLWVSAAEGFFIISGLLIGYLRLYKGARTKLSVLSKHLVARAGVLYLWCVGVTFAVAGLSVALSPDGALLPRPPDASQVTSLPMYVWNVFTMQYASDWIYFLRLYAYMLLTTPVFLWLVRKGYWSVALLLSVVIYAGSYLTEVNEAALQWQLLFFGAALIGWKLEAILSWLRARPVIRTELLVFSITSTIATMAISYFLVHGWAYVESPDTTLTRDAYVSIRSNVDPYFSNKPMAPTRVALSFLWFAGLLGLFHVFRTEISKYLGWLLMAYGTRSLSFYILHALLLPFIVTTIVVSDSKLLNTLIGAAVLLLIWALMRIPALQKALPR